MKIGLSLFDRSLICDTYANLGEFGVYDVNMVYGSTETNGAIEEVISNKCNLTNPVEPGGHP